MAVFGGKYRGKWGEYKSTYIQDNKLWLDGSDSDVIYVDESDNVRGFIDKSENLNETIKHIYDFSSDSDGWTNVRASRTNVVIYGKETVKFYASNTPTITHFAQLPNGSLTGYAYRITGDVWMPSSNTNVDRFAFYDDINTVTTTNAYFTSTETDQWVHFDFTFVPVNSNNLYLVMMEGTSKNFTGAGVSNDDILYLADVTTYFIDGNHFIQTTTAAQPSYSSPTVGFDGIQEFLDGSNSITNFTGDTQGEWIFVSKAVASNTEIIALANSTTETIGFMVSSPNFKLQLYSNSTTAYVKFNDSPSLGTTNIISYSSNGSKYKAFLNGLESAVFSGTDDGDWHSSAVTPDSFEIGRVNKLTPTYLNSGSIKEIIYYDRQLTNKERKAIFRMLNEKYAIY